MKVKELICLLLDTDMEDDIRICGPYASEGDVFKVEWLLPSKNKKDSREPGVYIVSDIMSG